MRGELDGLVGVYEKSLPRGSWEDTFGLAADSGYDFVELSVDESAERMDRLSWTAHDCERVRRAAADRGIRIGTVALSAQRAQPMGSIDPDRRARSQVLIEQAIQLAARLGAPIVQVAGYFTFYESSHSMAREFFLEGLSEASSVAHELGVVLAVENVDGSDVTSVEDGVALVRDVASPDVGLYVDVGNVVGNGGDVARQLRVGSTYIFAVQLKDARPGVFRRVPFGAGCVDFALVFRTLREVGYSGPLSVEMWNDADDPELARGARRYLDGVGLNAL